MLSEKEEEREKRKNGQKKVQELNQSCLICALKFKVELLRVVTLLLLSRE